MTPSPSEEELIREIKELKALVHDLSTKVEELYVQRSPSDRSPKSGKSPKARYVRPPSVKDSTEPIIIGAKVELLTSAKYGKKGDRGTVYDFNDHYVYVALEIQKCTTKREPQNVRYV